MRIGHYTPNIRARAGVGTYVRRVGQAQTRAGHEVFYFSFAPSAGTKRCITLHNHQEIFEHTERLAFDVLHLHRAVSPLPRNRVPTIRTLHGHEAYCPSGSRYLEQRGRPCDRAYSLAGCLWGHLVDQCGSRRPRKIRAHFRHTQHEMRTLPTLPVHTVSQFQKTQMVRSGYDAENIHVLHSPAPDVNDELPPPQEGLPRFVFLGRIDPQKGVSWLLKALARVEADVRLDVAGEGYMMKDVQRLAARLDLTDRVTFHGWVNADEVNQLIQASRAVVFPSVWHEPAGLVTLEAAAHGRPVVASRTGGIPEYASEEYALLVPPHDIDALASCMERLAKDIDLAEGMGREGRQIVQERFAMGDFVRRLDETYRMIIDGGVDRKLQKTAGDSFE